MTNKQSEHIEAIMREMMNTEGWKYLAELYLKEVQEKTDDLIDNSSGNAKLEGYTGEVMRLKAFGIKMLKMFINKPQEMIALFNTTVEARTAQQAIDEANDLYKRMFPE